MKRMRLFTGMLALMGGVIVALVIAGCHTESPATPLSQLNPQQLHGHVVFQAQCALCHLDREKGSTTGPSLLGVYRKPSLPSGAAATDERVTATILRGRGMMPAFGNRLSPDEVDDLVAYLHTL